MRRIRLSVAYDGTEYCGWQIQPNGVTIEEKLNKALSELTRENIQVIGASRTDSGVHALGNEAVFDTESRIPAEKFAMALNARLPEDIVVQRSEEAAPDYHPRKCNSIKTYEYHILNRKLPDPLRRRYAAFCYFDLNVEDMQRAAAYLVGEHDFAAFCSSGSQAEDTIRIIYEATVMKEGDMITIRLRGNGFLYNMVRIITGTLLEVGRGKFTPADMKHILNERDRTKAGSCAPAVGLTLVSIEHPEKLPEQEHFENDFVAYSIDRSLLESEGIVKADFERCREEEWRRMISRTCLHAFRDGAKTLMVKGIPEQFRDLETEKNYEKTIDNREGVVLYYSGCGV